MRNPKLTTSATMECSFSDTQHCHNHQAVITTTHLKTLSIFPK